METVVTSHCIVAEENPHLLDLNNSYATLMNEVLPVLGILLYINTWDVGEGWSPEFATSVCLLCSALLIKFTSSNLR